MPERMDLSKENQETILFKPGELPGRIIEVPNNIRTVGYTKDQVPWLKSNQEVRIALVHLQGGREFYYGKMIVEPLDEIAQRLDKQGLVWRNRVESAFATCVPGWVERHQHKDIQTVKRAATKKSGFETYYIKSNPLVRIYFLANQRIDDKHVIIRVAECKKTDENDVFKSILERN